MQNQRRQDHELDGNGLHESSPGAESELANDNELESEVSLDSERDAETLSPVVPLPLPWLVFHEQFVAGVEQAFVEPWLRQVALLADQVAVREGVVIYDIEVLGSGRARVLRVYLDKPEGAGIQDCTRVSHGLNQLLDEQDVVPGEAYQLEVSTPGLDRHVRQLWQYEMAIGRRLSLKLHKSLGEVAESDGSIDKGLIGAKNIEEVLVGVRAQKLVFKIKETEVLIPFDEIQKAKWVFRIVKGQKKK